MITFIVYFSGSLFWGVVQIAYFFPSLGLLCFWLTGFVAVLLLLSLFSLMGIFISACQMLTMCSLGGGVCRECVLVF